MLIDTPPFSPTLPDTLLKVWTSPISLLFTEPNAMLDWSSTDVQVMCPPAKTGAAKTVAQARVAKNRMMSPLNNGALRTPNKTTTRQPGKLYKTLFNYFSAAETAGRSGARSQGSSP